MTKYFEDTTKRELNKCLRKREIEVIFINKCPKIMTAVICARVL